MSKLLYLIANFLLALVFCSCAKEEFAAIKGTQNSSINPINTTSSKICSQSTLISPKVDILLLWDNSSSAVFINSATKGSFNQLITSVSEKFDYHILSAPLISTAAINSLSEASLVVKDSAGISGNASGIIKSKDQAATALNFSRATGSAEPGIDRATSLIETNRSNGIFRNDAYMIIVIMSNGDDTSCEMSTGFNSCPTADLNKHMQTKINKLLCLRGNANGIDCSAVTPLNSTMMRFINIAPLTSCSSGLAKINTRYRNIAKAIYDTSYTNGWPTSNDNLSPFTSGGTQYPDSYDICSIDLNHIFDGVNTAIKQTLIKHVYEFWPITNANTSLDPDTIKVVRDDGKILVNRSGQSAPTDGYSYIGLQNNHFTRSLPTQGENFSGQMIQLFGVNDNDFIVYPHCLTVTFDAQKLQYGYIYLQKGEPLVSSIEVHLIQNGTDKIIPQDATNGWEYGNGVQYVAALNQSLKIVDLPSGASSGYFLKLNGSYKFNNTAGSTTTVKVNYTSKSN